MRVGLSTTAIFGDLNGYRYFFGNFRYHIRPAILYGDNMLPLVGLSADEIILLVTEYLTFPFHPFLCFCRLEQNLGDIFHISRNIPQTTRIFPRMCDDKNLFTIKTPKTAKVGVVRQFQAKRKKNCYFSKQPIRSTRNVRALKTTRLSAPLLIVLKTLRKIQDSSSAVCVLFIRI